MENSKLIKILRTFSNSEMKDFRRFIISPYYNKEGQYITRFFDELRKFAPDFDNKKLSGEKIFSKIYAGKEFNKTLLRRIVSELVKLATEFLKIKGFEKKEFYSRLLFLTELRERNLYSNFISEAAKIRKDLNSKPFERDIEYYNNILYLEYEADRMYVNKNITNFESCLPTIENTVNLFVIATKLDLFKSMLSEGYISSRDKYDMWLKEDIVEYVKNNSLEIRHEHPIIYGDFLIFKMFEDLKEEGYYHDLKKFILANKTRFKPGTLRYFFSQMMNYCILKQKFNSAFFKKERFEIMKELESTSLLLIKESAHIDYLNFVTITLELRQFEWSKSFIHKYKNYINPDIREDTYNLALAKYYYAQTENKLALNHLKKIKYIDFYYYFFINRMILKIYYEECNIEGILSLIDSMNHFIKRTKAIPEQYKYSNKKFLEYIIKLVKAKTPEDYNHLKKTLKQEGFFPEKNWIDERIQQKN